MKCFIWSINLEPQSDNPQQETTWLRCPVSSKKQDVSWIQVISACMLKTYTILVSKMCLWSFDIYSDSLYTKGEICALDWASQTAGTYIKNRSSFTPYRIKQYPQKGPKGWVKVKCSDHSNIIYIPNQMTSCKYELGTDSSHQCLRYILPILLFCGDKNVFFSLLFINYLRQKQVYKNQLSIVIKKLLKI